MTQKQIKKIVEKLVEGSFNEGKVIESRIAKSVKILKTLTRAQSILALSEYLKGLKRIERAHTMYIETSIPLSPIQIKKMKKIVEKKVKITKVMHEVNPDILGGFKLKVGDEVWDESILGKINQIKEGIIRG